MTTPVELPCEELPAFELTTPTLLAADILTARVSVQPKVANEIKMMLEQNFAKLNVIVLIAPCRRNSRKPQIHLSAKSPEN